MCSLKSSKTLAPLHLVAIAKPMPKETNITLSISVPVVNYFIRGLDALNKGGLTIQESRDAIAILDMLHARVKAEMQAQAEEPTPPPED